MKRPGILNGIVIALFLSVIASAIYFVAKPLFGGGLVLRALITLMSLAYIVYLLRGSRVKIGKLTTVALWLVVSVVVWLWAPPLAAYLLIHTGLIWLVRSFYFHSSIVTSLADLGLSLLAIIAAVWAAMHSNSLFLSVWCFFLVQALFVMVPARWTRKIADNMVSDEPDHFQNAWVNADAALRKISTCKTN
ncbi:MAG: hypothetical protein JXA04_12070 [Gammaproteobacteria bacterium]|nr:hypothetical protein [Gammaproteobacteria bacterium]